MRATFLQWCRTGSYFLFAVFFLWLGYRVQKHLIPLDDSLNNNLLIVIRDSPYLSLSFPLWSANLIAGVLLLCTLLLIAPVIPVLRQRLFHFVVFCILLLICVLPLHVHFDVTHLKQSTTFFSFHTVSFFAVCSISLCAFEVLLTYRKDSFFLHASYVPDSDFFY